MLNIFTYFKSAPKFKVWHSHPNQSSQVLITAGMHGDELSSIEAAKELIKTYKGNIPITIVPILNLAGFNSGVSRNPFDNLDPIYHYPGSHFGGSTARLMYDLSLLTKNKMLWIDLHGGAKGEYLIPFVWAPRPYSYLSHLKTRTLVDKTFERDIPYLILESGQLGKLNQKDVNTHLDWVKTILENLNSRPKTAWKPTFNQIVYQKRSKQTPDSNNVLWYSRDLYVSGKMT